MEETFNYTKSQTEYTHPSVLSHTLSGYIQFTYNIEITV